MDFSRFSQSQDDQPLCKFGPGGDYLTNWPAEDNLQENVEPQLNPIGKILSTIADMVGATLDPEILEEMTRHADIEGPVTITIGKEDITDEKTNKGHNTQAACRPETSGPVRKQTMLFSDDWRTGPAAGRKQANRVRTHRRPAKKRSNYKIKGQGTLFEINFVGQSAA